MLEAERMNWVLGCLRLDLLGEFDQVSVPKVVGGLSSTEPTSSLPQRALPFLETHPNDWDAL